MKIVEKKITYTCSKCNKNFIDFACKNRVFCSLKCAGIDENMDINAPRKCTKCGVIKNPEEFYLDSTKKITGRRPDCKECNKKGSAKWAKNNKKDVRSRQYFWSIKHRYNLTKDQYNAMLLEQSGKCAICDTIPKLNRKGENTVKMHVDHCHKTGKVRGLLCGKCNSAIGLFEDDTNRMKNAIMYIERNIK